MTNLLKLREDLDRSWRAAPSYSTCVEIINFVADHKEQLKVITYRTLLNALGRKCVDQELLSALTILASSRVHLLDTGAFFYDGEQEFELSPQDWAEVRIKGEFAHPLTGSSVEDYQSRIVPFFTLSSRVLGSE